MTSHENVILSCGACVICIQLVARAEINHADSANFLIGDVEKSCIIYYNVRWKRNWLKHKYTNCAAIYVISQYFKCEAPLGTFHCSNALKLIVRPIQARKQISGKYFQFSPKFCLILTQNRQFDFDFCKISNENVAKIKWETNSFLFWPNFIKISYMYSERCLSFVNTLLV